MTGIRALAVLVAFLLLAPTALAQDAPLAFVGPGGERQRITHVDPETLRPTGRPARLPAGGFLVDAAPDGSRLGVLTLFEDKAGRDQALGLSVVRSRSLKTLGSRRLGLPFQPYGLAYLRADRLVLAGASFGGAQGPRLLILDPATRTVVKRVRLPGVYVGSTQVGERLAIATRPVPAEGALEAPGPTTLSIVDADGIVGQTASVPDVDPASGLSRSTDLELDPATGRVLVVTDGAAPQVASVDPDTAEVALTRLPAVGEGGVVSWAGPRALVTARGREAGTLRHLDATGAQVAARTLPRGAGVSTDGSLVAAAGRVTAFDAGGAVRWRARLRRGAFAQPLGTRVIVVTGTRRPRVSALDGATGRRVAAPRPRVGTRVVAGESDGGRGPEPLFVAPFDP